MIRTDELEQAVAQAVHSASRRMTAKVRREAFSAGWPAHVSRHLSVRHSGGGFSVTYPEHLSEKVEALEYGTQSTAPSAVIRRFENRTPERDREVLDALERSMRGVL